MFGCRTRSAPPLAASDQGARGSPGTFLAERGKGGFHGGDIALQRVVDDPRRLSDPRERVTRTPNAAIAEVRGRRACSRTQRTRPSQGQRAPRVHVTASWCLAHNERGDRRDQRQNSVLAAVPCWRKVEAETELAKSVGPDEHS